MIGLNRWEDTPALNFAGPLMLAALATPLVDGFIKMMQEAETARVELETRVREREQLLKRNFERLRESERVKVEAQERQRIMQDMHDGLGSQLMSSLMLVEREAVSNDQFAQILRESIDDMRLAIDALAADDADLAAALGNLRFRMEPRLRAAGMELDLGRAQAARGDRPAPGRRAADPAHRAGGADQRAQAQPRQGGAGRRSASRVRATTRRWTSASATTAAASRKNASAGAAC